MERRICGGWRTRGRVADEAMFVAALLLVALIAGPGSASARGGINLSWNDCGIYGTELKFFACDTNAGTSALYVSAVAPVPMLQLNGVSIVIDLATSQPTLSNWWLMQTGGSRTQSVVGQFNFAAGPFNCLDIWAGAAVGGVQYTSNFGGLNRARLRGAAAVPNSVAADDLTEMYLFAFQLRHVKSVGAGSCAGCDDSACILLSSVQLTQPLGVGDYTLTGSLEREFVYWRCPGSFNVHGSGGCSFFCTTPAVKPTWGSIKSLYR